MFGGLNPAWSPTIFAQTETWNGTNWTEVNDLTTGRNGLGGTWNNYSSFISFGGDTQPPQLLQASTESMEWN